MLEPFISHSRATRYDTINRILQSTQCPRTPYITDTTVNPALHQSPGPATSYPGCELEALGATDSSRILQARGGTCMPAINASTVPDLH